MGYRREDDSGGISAECRGYEVRDRQGEKVGKVDEVFVNENDRPEYLGVKTGLLGNKLTLIPADLARTDDESRLVEVSESRERIKEAPSLGTNEEITAKREEEIRSHFGLESGSSSEPSGRSDTTPGYRDDSHSSGYKEEGRGESPTAQQREPWSDSGDDTESGSSGNAATAGAGGGTGTTQQSDDTTGTSGRSEPEQRREGPGKAPDHGSNRESVRVSVWREKARAERVVGDDGSEEVRIRKEWIQEEELVEIEDGRQR